jgi:hypothetical protein
VQEGSRKWESRAKPETMQVGTAEVGFGREAHPWRAHGEIHRNGQQLRVIASDFQPKSLAQPEANVIVTGF